MSYWVVFGTASVVIATCVVYAIVGLFEVLREPTLEGTVHSDLGSLSATSPDAGAWSDSPDTASKQVSRTRIGGRGPPLTRLLIEPGETIFTSDGRKVRIVDVIPVDEEGPFVGLLRVEPVD
jgi:hypothetical protein